MYVTITDIVGKKSIGLSYPIENFNSSKEVVIVRMFSDNIQYEFPDWTIDLKPRSKFIAART